MSVQDGREPEADRNSKRRWLVVVIAICVGWLVAMAVTSCLGLEYKSPVRIENWKPDPAGR